MKERDKKMKDGEMTDGEAVAAIIVGLIVFVIVWDYLWWFGAIPSIFAATLFGRYLEKNRYK